MSAPKLTSPLLTSAEVSALTGLSVTTLRNMRHQRRVPYLKLAGGAVRYRRDEIEAWIQQGSQPAEPVMPLALVRSRRSS